MLDTKKFAVNPYEVLLRLHEHQQTQEGLVLLAALHAVGRRPLIVVIALGNNYSQVLYRHAGGVEVKTPDPYLVQLTPDVREALNRTADHLGDDYMEALRCLCTRDLQTENHWQHMPYFGPQDEFGRPLAAQETVSDVKP